MDKALYKRYLENWLAEVDETEAQAPQTLQENSSITETGTLPFPERPHSDIHCITVIGQIEGHTVLPSQNKTTKYEHIIPQLIAVEETPEIKGVILILNTVGGDVEAGLALAELIASMTKPVVSLVLGGGHSIGVPLAVSARHSVIASTAAMTVHPIRMNGLFIGSPQTYDYMNKMQERIIGFVVEHSSVSRDKFTDLMLNTGDIANEIGTVLVGSEAVDCGLINEIGGINVAMKRLRELINLDEKKGM